MTTTQLTAADVKRLYAEKRYAEIETARRAGRLDLTLGMAPADVATLDKARGTGPLTTADVHALSLLGEHNLIEAARLAGRLTYLNTDPKEAA